MNDKKRARLQRLINAATKANNAKHTAEQRLNRFCEAEWGFAPCDRDRDQIIDMVYGGCGHSFPMEAEDFISEMAEVSRE